MTIPPAPGRPGLREGPNGPGSAAPFPPPRELPRPNSTTPDADKYFFLLEMVVDVDFPEVIRRHGEAIYRYLRFHCSCHEDAEDNYQEVVLRAYRAWNELDETGRLRPRPWLFTIAHNFLVSDHRRRSRRPEVKADVETLHATTDPYAQVDRQEQVATLLRVAALSALQADVVALRCFSDLSEAETAACLGKTIPSVRKAFGQAKRKLRLAEARLQKHAAETLAEAHEHPSRSNGMGR